MEDYEIIRRVMGGNTAASSRIRCVFALIFVLAILSTIVTGCASSVTSRPAPDSGRRNKATGIPEELVFHARELAEIRFRIAAGDTTLAPVKDKIIKAANSALKFKPVSVTNKVVVAESGDRHDYLSLARYAWPDPEKLDGLPYIIRDGVRNPEMDTIPDKKNLHGVIEATAMLTLAYHFTGDERYAQKAAEVLRVWFLDPATRMNPNGNYAQVLRGRGIPGGIGIIDFVPLAPIGEFISLLKGSKAWTRADQQAMNKWLSDFLDWLTTSKPGQNEAAARANHGTWYDTQVVAIALTLGKEDLARKVLEGAMTNRIEGQIEPDGRQPRETARTLGLHYSVYNLNALFRLAGLGERVGIDLWHFQTRDGRGIRKALDWLMPYLAGAHPWPYQQIDPFDPDHACVLLFRAGQKYHDKRYSDLGGRLAEGNSKLLLTLFRPI